MHNKRWSPIEILKLNYDLLIYHLSPLVGIFILLYYSLLFGRHDVSTVSSYSGFIHMYYYCTMCVWVQSTNQTFDS